VTDWNVAELPVEAERLWRPSHSSSDLRGLKASNINCWMASKTQAHARPRPDRGYNNLSSVNPSGGRKGREPDTMRTERATTLSFSLLCIGARRRCWGSNSNVLTCRLYNVLRSYVTDPLQASCCTNCCRFSVDIDWFVADLLYSLFHSVL